MMKKISAFVVAACLLVAFGSACAASGEQPAELPAEIKEVFLRGEFAYYDIVSCLVVEENFAVLAVALYDRTLLLVFENLYGQWKETITIYAAVYNTRTVNLTRSEVNGAWGNDGFVVSYQNDYGNWPAFTFSREGQGQWTFSTLEFHDENNVWRIERDFRYDYRFIFTNDQNGEIRRFDAHHPFEGDLRSFDAYTVPTSLQEAKAMLGDTLRPITEAEITTPPKSTEPPASNNSMAAEVPNYMVADAYTPGDALIAIQGVPDPGIPLETPHPVATPHWEALHGVETAFPPDQIFAVYSGPGTQYIRGDGGNAYVSTNGTIVVYGHENGYVLIEYRTSDGASRFGYVNKAHIPESENIKDLAFYRYPIILAEHTLVTDDPCVSQRPIIALGAQTPGHYLVNFGDWAYVETTDQAGNPVRGFIKEEGTLFGYE